MDKRKLGGKELDREEFIKLVQEITQEFNSSIGAVDLSMLLGNNSLYKTDNQDDTYTLLFSSKYLDDMDPFDSTLEVVKFFKKHNPSIFKKISRVITISTTDETVRRIKEMMRNKEENYSIDGKFHYKGILYNNNYSEKRHQFFGTTIEDGIILKVEDISVLG